MNEIAQITYKAQVIGPKVSLLPSDGSKRLKFKDTHEMVLHANNHSLSITNPDQIPAFYRVMLKNK